MGKKLTTEEFAKIVGRTYTLVDEIRDKDNITQEVNDNIETIPINYIKVEEGIKKESLN